MSLLSMCLVQYNRIRHAPGNPQFKLIKDSEHLQAISNSKVFQLVRCGSFEMSCRLRCVPRHLILAQNDEVRLKTAPFSSSSSDLSSERRDSLENSFHVTAKENVNLTELNEMEFQFFLSDILE
ncbi:hypothetical protein AVEN_85645-1 [Araneus ventricosus]|uniref:Uncharacterized protein n=1 Tax=Araneus ventricosus TaxID=182803 RepID=A0A4Y2LK69_ARAVE|nr:hypothetical protein AVEN_85645-1 [Araneus ventricosus]